MIEQESHKKKENLRQRAYLSSITAMLDYSARLGVGFFLNPFMIATLGPVLFGAWHMINQLNNYMSTADLNAAQPLKLIVSKERSVSSGSKLRKRLTAAFYAVIFFLPVYGTAGMFIIWLSPKIIDIGPEYDQIIRSALALLILAFLINQAFSLIEAVLRGMNLAYKRMGLRALIHVLGGILIAGSLHLGFGLAGIAAVKLIIAIITGVTLLWIVRKNVDWFGLEKVFRKDVLSFIKLSGWFMAQKMVAIIYRSYDILLLGFLTSPAIVSNYVITKFLMFSVKGGILNITYSFTPAFGKLLGENNLNKLFLARHQILSLVWIISTIAGVLICLWNNSFVAIWVGPDYFAGQWETLLIVLIAQQALLQDVDFTLINLTLNLRKLITITGASAVLSVSTAFVLIPTLQIVGLLIAILLGSIFVTTGYALTIKQALKSKEATRNVYCSRMAFSNTLMIALSAVIGDLIMVDNWLTLFIVIIISSVIISGFLWFVSLNPSDRQFLKEIIHNIKQFRNNKAF